jgi:hypothetical protein
MKSVVSYEEKKCASSLFVVDQLSEWFSYISSAILLHSTSFLSRSSLRCCKSLALRACNVSQNFLALFKMDNFERIRLSWLRPPGSSSFSLSNSVLSSTRRWRSISLWTERISVSAGLFLLWIVSHWRTALKGGLPTFPADDSDKDLMSPSSDRVLVRTKGRCWAASMMILNVNFGWLRCELTRLRSCREAVVSLLIDLGFSHGT